MERSGEVNNMRDFEKLYYNLFSIPRARVMVALSLALTAALTLLEKRIAFVWIATVISASVAIKAIKLKFDAKRIAFFALLISVLSLPGLILFKTPVTSYPFFIAAIYFCSEAGFILTLLLSLITYLALDPTKATLIAVTVLSLVFYFYLKALDVRVGKISIKSFVEKFVLFWLTSNPSYLEDFFESISTVFKGRVRCIDFGSAKLVSTDFHPGPFRNVGGAKMVERLSKGNTVYLHSPTSHARNPVTSKEVEKIARAVRCRNAVLEPCKPFEINGEKFDVYCFPFGTKRLIMVSGKEALDDFIVTSEHFVVDCHNAYKPNWDVGENEVVEIRKLVELASKVESEKADLNYAFVKMEVKTDSICNYVATLLLDYDGERYAIVVFDSNNIRLDFRRYVEDRFKGIGYKAVVASTDNHAKTGLRAKVSYKPAGDCIEDWKIVDELIERCRGVEFRKAECKFAESEVEVRVMGEDFLKDSEIAASKYAAKLIATFLVFAMLGFILPGLIFIWR